MSTDTPINITIEGASFSTRLDETSYKVSVEPSSFAVATNEVYTNTRFEGPNYEVELQSVSYNASTIIGSKAFTSLLDTPSNFDGDAGKFVAVHSSENGLVFTDVVDGGSY